MRPTEIADRDLMRDQRAERRAGKPGMQIEGRRLDPEGRRLALSQIEIDGVVRRRTDRTEDAGKPRQRRPMDMSAPDQLDARMPRDDLGQGVGIAQILPVHVPDARGKGRMMQEQQRRPVRAGG